MTFLPEKSPALPGSDEGRLLTHETEPGSANCLSVALRTARRDDDDVLFLGRVEGDGLDGHVVLRDRQTGTVREPGTECGLEDMEVGAYAFRHGLAVLGAVAPADIDALLALPVPARAAAVATRADTLAQVAGRQFGMLIPPVILPQPPTPPSGGSTTDSQDDHVGDWLDALGGSVSQSDKDALKQTADDAQTLKGWFDSHDRGDPALNDMPQNVADAESRLLSNPSISKQIHAGDAVTRDALGDFIGNLDHAADSARSSFQSFQRNNKDADAGEVGAAAQASILQADLPIIDASGSAGADVDGTFNLDDLNAVAASSDSGVPDPLKNAAADFTSSFDAFAKAGDAGDGLVNDKGLGKVVSDGIGLSRQDGAVHAWVDDLGGAVSDDDKTSLEQVGDDATTLKAWFDAHDRNDPALNDMPQNVADAENRLLGDDAVKKRINTSTDSGQIVVTRDSLGSFLGDLDKAAGSAQSSWDSFKKDNTAPDPVALRMAADANIVQGNLPILDAAGSDQAQVDGLINADDLNAVAAGKGTPAALASAAAVYANQGDVSKLDIAGDDPSTAPDGLIDNDNIDAYLAHDTSKNEDDTISSLKNDAIQQAIKDAGGDASKVGADYFKDPSSSKATGADKTAAIVQLSQTIARYNAGEQVYPDQAGHGNALSSADQYHQNYGDGPTPGETRDQYIKDVQGRIATLSQDKDVQSFLSDKLPQALQTTVAGDPGLKAAIQTQFDHDSSSQALQAAFDTKDKDGKPLTTTAALSTFLDKPNFYAQALGITPDYTKALDGAPQDIKDKVKQGYDDVTSGKEIDDLTKSGTPQDQALIQSAVDKTVYDSVLDRDTVQAGTDKFNDATGKLARAQLTDGKSGDDMLKGLGFSGADDPKLAQFIQDNLDQLAAPGKDQPPASEILTAVRQINDAMRGGLKFDDAMAKAKKNWTPTSGQPADAYKAGVFHGASALLLAGAMGARLATSGGNSNPIQTAQQSLGTAGLLAEGGAKYYGTTLDDLKQTIKADEARLKAFSSQNIDYQPLKDKLDAENTTYKQLTGIGKDVENVGKTIGGVAGNALGLIAGAIGAASSAKSGDIGNAAAQGIFAGLNGISSVASAGEVATYIAPRVASDFGSALSSDAAASAAAWGGIFGAVGGVVGGAAAVGGLIYAIVQSIKADDKKSADEADWYKQLQDGFAPSGLPVPDEGTLIAAPYGYVPDDGTSPVAY